MESNPKKRKLNMIQLQPIPFMLCEICKDKVYNYGECQTWIYCGYDCLSVLLLQYDNEKRTDDGWDSWDST